MKIKYKIIFRDYWHTGSGMSQGALSDAAVLKDKNGIVYVPGKTIKGLAREAAKECDKECDVEKCFGQEGDLMSAVVFKNAVLSRDEYETVVAQNLQKYLYDTLTFTKIDSKGTAQDDTLREIEVCVPLELEGEVVVEDDKCAECIVKALKKIKHIGLMRNRGLGRCHIEIKDEK